MDFLAGSFVGADALLMVLLAAGLAVFGDNAGVDDFNFEPKTFLPGALVDAFIAFAMPVTEPTVFKALGFVFEADVFVTALVLPVLAAFAFKVVDLMIETAGFFTGALRLVSRLAVAFVAEDDVPLFLDAVAMKVSVDLAGMTLAESSRTMQPPCGR